MKVARGHFYTEDLRGLDVDHHFTISNLVGCLTGKSLFRAPDDLVDVKGETPPRLGRLIP
jgi:hypothetical protein